MQEKDAIIILRPGKERLIFPGKKGYEIHLADDSKVMPITPSASGHYLISCDHFDQTESSASASSNGQTVFVVDYKNTEEYVNARSELDQLAEESGQSAIHVAVNPDAAQSSSSSQ